ncbi:MAG: DUF4372 domain-containing protein [Desulfomonilia bacterium]
MKILLEGRVVFSKKHQNPEGGLSRWYVAAAFSVKCYPLVDRMDFHRLVLKHDAERHAKGYSSWSHFVAMLFCQLAQAKSIREICGGLACCTGKMRHLGLKDFPKKSTLSYANVHRPWEMYRDLFYLLLERYRGTITGRKRKFRFRNKLLSLDSTTISLCLSMFPWGTVQAGQGGGEAASSAGS